MNSLEIVEKHVGEIKIISEYNKENSENYYSIVKYKELIQMKQDLEKYNVVMKLLKQVFSKMEVSYKWDCLTEDNVYYIYIQGASNYYLLNENLYNMLKKLEEISYFNGNRGDEK